MSIFLGFIFCIVGFLFTWKSESIFRMFGRVPFAEKYLTTSGGSRLFYKLLGILIIFIGFLMITGFHRDIGLWIGETLFGAYTPPPVEEVQKANEPVF